LIERLRQVPEPFLFGNILLFEISYFLTVTENELPAYEKAFLANFSEELSVGKTDFSNVKYC
jgi:hypothetical protein